MPLKDQLLKLLPEKKDDWDYPYSRELHDRMARVYCEDKFKNTEVDVDLLHRFLEVFTEFVDECPIEEEINNTIGNEFEWEVSQELAKAIRSLLKGEPT